MIQDITENRNDDDLLTLASVCAWLGKGGKRPSISTAWRWCRKGSGGVTLKYYRLGRGIRVRLSDLEDFGRKLAELDMAAPSQSKPFPPPKVKKPRTPEQRAASIAEAEARLRARGCM